MKTDKQVSVAIVGCGTVGGATARLLLQDGELLASRSGINIRVKYIVDVDFARAESLKLDKSLFQTDLGVVLQDSEVEIVIELIGGTTIARNIMEQCIRAGKHIVTANKALLAHHGAELMSMARKSSVSIAFEASCGGGIPIIRALYDGLISNQIDALYGIVNGTCNYILTSMIKTGSTYANALRSAQEKGLAEADPTLDVSGGDSAHKLAIMAAMAFGRRISFDDIPVEGIDTLKSIDVAFGQELGYVMKLLAIAQRTKEGLFLRVRPSFISSDHPLAWISGPFNAVSVYGHCVGHTMYYGRGAGGSPTSSAVVADVISIAIGSYRHQFNQLNTWQDGDVDAVQLPIDQLTSRHYLRVNVIDRPGVFARLAAILGDHRISLSSVLQKEPPEDAQSAAVPVVITTHSANEGNVRKALSEIDRLDVCLQPSVCINIIDEHEEKL
ncbi:MAG: homoserine dehydrogenase [Spirochaetales bacterium]|nr:homoserine dehydrogenase [Spirochaetales bacterium]